MSNRFFVLSTRCMYLVYEKVYYTRLITHGRRKSPNFVFISSYFCGFECHIVSCDMQFDLAIFILFQVSLRWRHNVRDSVSNHQPHDCLLDRVFRRRLKKTSKLRVTGLCAGNSPGTGEFPAQMASYAENVSIWWRHHDRRECMNFEQVHISDPIVTNANHWPVDLLCTYIKNIIN